MKQITFFLFLFFLPVWLFSQANSISPYSGFGLGQPAPQGYDRSFAMGGVGLAFNDSIAINPQNPATYSFFKTNNPIFQFSYQGQLLRVSSEINSSEVYNGGLNNIALGFRVGKKVGIALGLNPITSVGYKIIFGNEITDPNGETFPLLNQYEGSGGYTKYYLGGSYKLLEKRDSLYGSLSVLSLGVNLSYFGGKVNRSFDLIYDEPQNTFLNTRTTSSEIINGFGVEFGLYYQLYIKKNTRTKFTTLSIGITSNIPKNMSTRFETIVTTYKNVSEVSIPRDTIIEVKDIKGKSFIPLDFSVGFMLNFSKKVQLGVDYEFHKWGDFKQVISDFELDGNQLVNSSRLGIGIQYNPIPRGTRGLRVNYFKLITYRAGFHYEKGYLMFEDYKLEDKAVTFGLNLPFSKSQSYSSLNLGIEFGSGGTTANGLLEEQYFNFMVGVTLLPHRFNRWFTKREYK